jgi:hypothetical protein
LTFCFTDNATSRSDVVAGEVAKSVVEGLEVVDIGHQQRERLALGGRFRDRLGESGVEIFAVSERGELIGETFGAHRLEIMLQVLDLLARCASLIGRL